MEKEFTVGIAIPTFNPDQIFEQNLEKQLQNRGILEVKN